MHTPLLLLLVLLLMMMMMMMMMMILTLLLLQARLLILTALRQPSRVSTATGARLWQMTTRAQGGSSTTGMGAAGSTATSGSGEPRTGVAASFA
jgi:hypothetical protein